MLAREAEGLAAPQTGQDLERLVQLVGGAGLDLRPAARRAQLLRKLECVFEIDIERTLSFARLRSLPCEPIPGQTAGNQLIADRYASAARWRHRPRSRNAKANFKSPFCAVLRYRILILRACL